MASVPPVLPATDLASVSWAWFTVVIVRHSADGSTARQFDPGPVTTTMFGRVVAPVGNVLSSVTLKVTTACPAAGIEAIVQLSTPAVFEHAGVQLLRVA